MIATNVVESVNVNFFPSSSGNNIYAEYAENVDIKTFGRFANYGGLYGAANVFANYSGGLSVECNSFYSEIVNGRRYATNTSCNDVALYRMIESDDLKCQGFGCGDFIIDSRNGLKDYAIDYNGCGACDSLQDCFKRENIQWKVSCFDEEKNKMVSDIFDGEHCFGESGICCDGISENNFRNQVDECLDLSESQLLNVNGMVSIKNVDKGWFGRKESVTMQWGLKHLLILLCFGVVGLFFLMMGVLIAHCIQSQIMPAVSYKYSYSEEK